MDPYAVLGVTRDATDGEIRATYHRRAALLHPDRHQGAPPEVVAEAERAMRALNDAWAVLGDPDRRRAFDLGTRRPAGGDRAATAPRDRDADVATRVARAAGRSIGSAGSVWRALGRGVGRRRPRP